VIGLLAAIAAAGCGGRSERTGATAGGADERPAAAPATDTGGEPATVTCAELLPPAEARSLLGVDPDKVKEDARPGATACTWYYTPAGSVQRVFISALVTFGPGAADMWLPMRDSEARNDSRQPAAVAGIGDEAYTWVGQADYRRLYVRRGGKTLVIRGPVALPALAETSAMAELAGKLLGRF